MNECVFFTTITLFSHTLQLVIVPNAENSCHNFVSLKSVPKFFTYKLVEFDDWFFPLDIIYSITTTQVTSQCRIIFILVIFEKKNNSYTSYLYLHSFSFLYKLFLSKWRYTSQRILDTTYFLLVSNYVLKVFLNISVRSIQLSYKLNSDKSVLDVHIQSCD